MAINQNNCFISSVVLRAEKTFGKTESESLSNFERVNTDAYLSESQGKQNTVELRVQGINDRFVAFGSAFVHRSHSFLARWLVFLLTGVFELTKFPGGKC